MRDGMQGALERVKLGIFLPGPLGDAIGTYSRLPGLAGLGPWFACLLWCPSQRAIPQIRTMTKDVVIGGQAFTQNRPDDSQANKAPDGAAKGVRCNTNVS